MLKRIITFLLVFLFALGSYSFAMEKPMPFSTEKKTKSITERITDNESSNKKVRVIVEMKDEAPIEHAIQRGVTFNKLDQGEKQRLEKQAKQKQANVKSEMKDKGVEAEYLNEFTAVVNGFSAEVNEEDIELIKNMAEVKTVHITNEYERPVIEPEMKYSKELVEAQRAWRDYGYQGEGMVVGIIDTGIDYNHQDMIITNNDAAALSEGYVNDTINSEELPGQFYTEKIPYGYNYMDENNEVRDKFSGASMHGMHVGGTVGANGDEDDGGILGIAPETQLLALKVFGNDPEFQSTYGDIYIKAIDDAIKLGADVLNMSLGSPSSFVDADSPEQQAIKRAVDSGILMSISAGNSAMFGDGYYYPLAENPDYGVSGAPGLSYDSLQVASFENTYMDVDAVNYTIGSEEEGNAPFLSAGNTHPSDYVKTEFEAVTAGLGEPADFEGLDVKGKYALIQRGEIDFTDKVLNAQAAGAVGVIIYNNVDGIVNMATEDTIEIPQLFMLKNDGDKLVEALEDGQTVTLNFLGETGTIDNPDSGKMSDFTSWGLTPNLDFKPEITAPGGQIQSTLNDNQYGIMSGTSMAAPHVSGGGALLLQRVDEEFGFKDSDRVLQAKNVMMNTAKLVEFEETLVSPRRQGAGMMQLHAALSTPVLVTESTTNEAKVALKQVNENTVTFELAAENFTDESVTYDVKANVQTDAPVQNGPDLLVAPNLFGALDLDDMATTTVNGEEVSKVEVPANGTVTMTVTIDVNAIDESLAATFINGYWLEGFVTLTDPNDTYPELSVPYVGFKGDWDAASIFDDPIWEADSYYGMTGVVTKTGEDEDGNVEYGFLGEDLTTGAMDPDKIAFSPNGDGVQDDAVMILSFLRNAKDVKFNVLDENKQVVRTITTETDLRKNYYDGGRAPMYSLSASRVWDGKIAGKAAPEGQYYLQAQAKIDFPGAEWQTLDVPVLLDTTAPELTASFDSDKQVVTVKAKDNEGGSGLAYWDVLVNGKSILDEVYVGEETEHQLIKKLGEDDTLSVVAVDYAGNKTEEEAMVGEDVTPPDLHLLTPEVLGVYADGKVTFSGYVKDPSGIKEVTIDGKKAELVYNEEKDHYDFSLTIDHKKDGYFFYHIKAVDTVGNETEIGRRFFVDTEKPKVKAKVKGPKKVDTDTITVEVDIDENFDDIRLYVNGNEIYKHELSEPYGMNRFKETIKDIELPLEDGENTFLFEVVDLGGHVATDELVIEKRDKGNNGNNGNGNDKDN